MQLVLCVREGTTLNYIQTKRYALARAGAKNGTSGRTITIHHCSPTAAALRCRFSSMAARFSAINSAALTSHWCAQYPRYPKLAITNACPPRSARKPHISFVLSLGRSLAFARHNNNASRLTHFRRDFAFEYQAGQSAQRVRTRRTRTRLIRVPWRDFVESLAKLSLRTSSAWHVACNSKGKVYSRSYKGFYKLPVLASALRSSRAF